MKRIISIIIILIVIVTVTMSPICIGYIYGARPNITEFWLQYTSVLLSSISFIAVIYTIWKQNKAEQKHQMEINQNYEFARQNYDMQILNVIEKFSSAPMIECRKSCNILLSKFNDDVFMKDFKNLLKSEACGYLNDKDFYIKINSEAYKYYMDFIQITHFFNVLSFYDYNPKTANAIQYYYDYYRSLFVRIDYLYVNILKELPQEYVKNYKDYFCTQWSNILLRFDKIMRDNQESLQVKKHNGSMGGLGQYDYI